MTIKELFSAIGPHAMLDQLTEECCELGKAAMKVIRAMGEGTPTPVSLGEARENLVEELADVTVMLTLLKVGFLTEVENYDVEQTLDRKLERFVERVTKDLQKRAEQNPTN